MSKVVAIMSMSLDGYVADRIRTYPPRPRRMAATQLDCTLRDRVIRGVGVTHLRYPVRKA